MDFFSQQEKAKRYTKMLLLYFLIAITLIVVAVNIIIYYFFIFLEFYPYTPENWFSDGLVYYISGATCLLILSGSLFRWLKLKTGGHAVAAMVGAKRIDLNTTDNKQRQLIHVVEEMSIASGVPLPGLYVLESETGINAFVAGYLPTEAVMVVTAGAIEHFTRDEMQGVVAHEYSHILNGDMQINIRLMAMLAGVLMISSLGHILIESQGRRHIRSSSGKGSGGLAILGFLLLLVGYIGVFFGRMIKAAVSRQREYLADAASVQFTRNPGGIASALNKIRETSGGSRMKNAFAEDMSHMCFAQAIKIFITQWLATHPPLMERIKRIDPGYVGRIKARELNKKYNENNTQTSQENINLKNEHSEHSVVGSMMGFSAGMDPAPITSYEFTETAGKIDQAHIQFAMEIRQSFSEDLMNGVHQPEAAKIIVLDMILVRMDVEVGLQYLKARLTENENHILKKFKDEVSKLESYQRLPLFDLLLPTLKQMDEEKKVEYLKLCEQFIKADKRYTLFEFVLLSLLKQHLSPLSGNDIKIKYHSFKAVKKELQVVFSVMAHSSQCNDEVRKESYEKVVEGFPGFSRIRSSGKSIEKASGESVKGSSIDDFTRDAFTGELLSYKKITPKKISTALQRLSQLSPLLKRSVLEASADIAMHDGQLKYTEAELLRAIADLLNCPLPPLLPQAVN